MTTKHDNQTRQGMIETVVAEHETGLLRYAARLVNDPTAAQDVVQNVFTKLFQKWPPGMQPSKQLRSWLFRATHNEAVDYIRRESRLRKLHTKHAEERATTCPDGIHCDPTTEERKAIVLRHLNALLPRERQILILRMQEGMSYREISQVTGRSEGNVGNILHHAVKKLSSRLAGVLS